MVENGDKKCECGFTQYGYYCDNAAVYICYKCGKFDCEGFSDKVNTLFEAEPELVLQMIEDGYLIPLAKQHQRFDV